MYGPAVVYLQVKVPTGAGEDGEPTFDSVPAPMADKAKLCAEFADAAVEAYGERAKTVPSEPFSRSMLFVDDEHKAKRLAELRTGEAKWDASASAAAFARLPPPEIKMPPLPPTPNPLPFVLNDDSLREREAAALVVDVATGKVTKNRYGAPEPMSLAPTVTGADAMFERAFKMLVKANKLYARHDESQDTDVGPFSDGELELIRTRLQQSANMVLDHDGKYRPTGVVLHEAASLAEFTFKVIPCLLDMAEQPTRESIVRAIRELMADGIRKQAQCDNARAALAPVVKNPSLDLAADVAHLVALYQAAR